MAKPEKPQPDRAPQEAASGQLTPSEAQRLEAREAALRQQIADDRSASGGKLTAGEREQLSKELDEISTNLSRLKHDSQPTQEK